MRKLVSLLLAILLVCSVVPLASADSLIKSAAKNSAEFYTIGTSENTFSGLYDRMHVYLDLKAFPIPEPDTSRFTYVTGQHDEFKILKDDDDTFEYIGYVCMPDGARTFIIWSWSGYHEDGSLIGIDSYYALNGVYLGNIQRDYTNNVAVSSRNAPFFYNNGTLYGRK